jgi:uncharacterized protein YmfQ (DUF2313 family)
MLIYTLVQSAGGARLYSAGGDLIVAFGVVVADDAPPPFERRAYALGMRDLLPSGAAWPRGDTSTLQLLIDALAAEFARVDERLGQLLVEANPREASELLADWERVEGLPDPCVTSAQTVAQRRESAHSKLTYGGGQSRAFFIALAQSLGYTITIDEFGSAAEATAAGVPFTGEGWAHTWRVNVPALADVREFRAGSGAAGEPLRTWGNEALECRFQRLKPAHTICLFAYL